jgi:general secretion pathway protein E
VALAHGMQTMRGDAQRWIDSGATALEEVLRVTRD